MRRHEQVADAGVVDRSTVRRHASARHPTLSDSRLLLAGILLLAVVIRFVDIGSPLGSDDGYSYIVGAAPTVHAFLERLAGSENTPPLFYLLLEPLPIGRPIWLLLPAVLPGAVLCALLYLAVRRPLGERVALLAALAVAVAPLLVTYSDAARAFMLGDVALLIALGAILRLDEKASPRWWLVYVLAGIVSVYSEYDSAIFLLALTASALWLGRGDRRRMAVLGPAPILALIPWIPQLLRAQDALNRTKVAPASPPPSLPALRDVVVTLALGEYGGTTNLVLRWLEVAVFAAVAAAVIMVLRRQAARAGGRAGRAILLSASTGVLDLLGHAIAGAAGINVFDSRYLTILIPLTAVLAAAAVVATGRRAILVLGAALLVALGAIGIVKRYHRDFQPDLTPVRNLAEALHARTVLTNSSVVVYYLRSLGPALDRPFNLGQGRGRTCARPCLIIDDRRIPGPPRPVTDSHTAIGPFLLTLER